MLQFNAVATVTHKQVGKSKNPAVRSTRKNKYAHIHNALQKITITDNPRPVHSNPKNTLFHASPSER